MHVEVIQALKEKRLFSLRNYFTEIHLFSFTPICKSDLLTFIFVLSELWWPFFDQ